MSGNIDAQGSATLDVGKNIVASDMEELKGSFKQMIADGLVNLTLDCSRLEIIDSIGIGLLVATHNSLAQKSGTLKLINTSPDIYNLLTTMRLHKHFTVLPASK
ncbi:MAG: STAS domain-containing protein [Desulfovibrio sp.]